jgi:hypothetical protein
MMARRVAKFIVCYPFCLPVGISLILMSLGCGSGTPPSSVAATANPLVAQYTIQFSHLGLSAWVEFGPDTTYGRQTSVMTNSVTTPGGATLPILVAGMKAQTTYHMRAHVTWTGGSWVDEDQTFTTGALPTSPPLPTFAVTRPTPGLTPAPGVELLSLLSQAGNDVLSASAVDLEGNVIWYCPLEPVPVKLLPNGHMIMNLVTSLAEVDLACNNIRNVTLAQVNQSLQTNGYPFSIVNFSHDILVQPNGHWITIGQISKNFTDLPGYPGTTAVLGDVVVDIDTDNNVVWAWSAFDYLDVNRHLFGLPDWTHSNALVYTPDGNLLLSMRNQSWILKLDYADGTGSGNVLWKLGNEGDFSLASGGPSDWFYGQHNPGIVTTDGSQTSLAIFDDGNYRIGSDGLGCGAVPPAPCYTRATIFQIDESTNGASLLWQYTPGFFSWWGGSIGVLSNGDVEFDSSEPFDDNASQINEVTYTSSPQVVWQLNITGENAYRGFRIPSLYPGVTWQK